MDKVVSYLDVDGVEPCVTLLPCAGVFGPQTKFGSSQMSEWAELMSPERILSIPLVSLLESLGQDAKSNPRSLEDDRKGTYMS